MDDEVPPPETSVVLDGLLFRCELVVYISKGGQVKDVRLRGPLRGTRQETLKDCIELRDAAVQGGQDSKLINVREKRKELEAIVWTAEDLSDDLLEGAEGPAALPASVPATNIDEPERTVEHACTKPGDATRVDIEERVSAMKQDHNLDDAAAVKLVSVFRERAKLGCDLRKDFDELNQHLAASNKPSALVSMKLAELRDGRAIGPCKFAGGRKDAGAAKKLAGSVRTFSAEEAQAQRAEPAHRPVGPNWRKPGTLCRLPADEGDWLVHERQESGGKYRPWLFFNGDTGRYFQEKDSGVGYIGVGVPHDPRDHALTIRASSASLPSRAGKKLDMAVLLPELHKTGAILKQPLEFLDRPASLFVLCDGLRNTSAATEFCVKKFHSLLLPRLSARATEWEDFELADILREATEVLDSLLLDAPVRFAGCGFAVALLVGTRLVVGSLGATRCLLCGPASQGPQGRAKHQDEPWAARLLGGGTVHTAASREECMRIASAGDRLLEQGGCGHGAVAGMLHPRSASQAAMEAASNDQDRELLRVSRATNPFAALGLAAADLQEGAAAVRRIFRKRSLAVHPDKVSEAMKTRAVAAFAKLEAATTAVEAMLQADASATALVAELFAAHDGSWTEADPAAAARLLGVPEGCSAPVLQEATRQRFHGPLSRLQEACPKEVKQLLKILEGAEAAVLRGTALWTPPEADAAVGVTRALGCADLKAPSPLLATGLATQVVELEPGGPCAVVLLADGARGLRDEDVALRLQRHRGRPRAAALQLALDAAAAAESSGAGPEPRAGGEAVGTVCAYVEPLAAAGPAPAGPTGGPAAKRPKTGGGKPSERVRVSHVLLRWAGLKGADVEERPGFPAPKRNQTEAEQELLALLAELSAGDPKTRAARFKTAVLKRSECPSALNVPYADLGWLERGVAEPALEAAAFDTSVGDLSDIVLTPRGVHLLYRLA